MTKADATPTTSCVLLLRDGHALNGHAEAYCRAHLRLLAAVESSQVDEAALAALAPDFVISFLNETILRGALLAAAPGVNFHPAPPSHPGRGGASVALFEGAESYGATAHVMARAVDSGAILAVQRFPISQAESCEVVYGRAELAAMALFFDIVRHIGAHGNLPPASGEAWTRRPMTKKEFNRWLILDPDQPDQFRRKIQASRHSRFPGPYLDVHGARFAYIGDTPPLAPPS